MRCFVHRYSRIRQRGIKELQSDDYIMIFSTVCSLEFSFCLGVYVAKVSEIAVDVHFDCSYDECHHDSRWKQSGVSRRGRNVHRWADRGSGARVKNHAGFWASVYNINLVCEGLYVDHISKNDVSTEWLVAGSHEMFFDANKLNQSRFVDATCT